MALWPLSLFQNRFLKSILLFQFLQSISYLTTNHGEYANINIPIIIPLDLELDIDGIGGIYPGNSFHSNYLPSRYKHSTIFQAFDISHKVDNSGWTTSIGGKMRATKGGVFIGLKHIQKVFKIKNILRILNFKNNF